MRRVLASLFLSLMAVLMVLPTTAQAAPTTKVYVLHIDRGQQIDPGLTQIARRVFAEAEAHARSAGDPSAAAVAILLDTPGGFVASANQIKDLIMQTDLKTVGYVSGDAFSAGALIATATEKLYMHPSSAIGAAEPREMGSSQRADYKVVSALVKSFESTAEARGRNTAAARAMVDRDAPIPGQKTALLTLTYREAVETGYADGEASSLENALAKAGIGDHEVIDIAPTFSEKAGRFLTDPLVATLLLVIGVIAIGIEFIKPGVTIPGVIGVFSLGLFFLGNSLVGTAGWLELALALIGILLLVVEAFVPGFGVFGVGGVISMAASIIMAAPTPALAIQYLMWTTLASTVALFFLLRTISRRGLGKVLTLKDTAHGWTAPRADLSGLVGREGTAQTVLRPAGTALFGNEKVDVVAEGEFIPAGTLVKIIRVEGTRVVVRSK